MTKMLRRFGFQNIAFAAAEDGGAAGGGSAGGGAPAATGADASSILFPNEGEGKGAESSGSDPAGKKEGDAPPSGDWKEYENDPAKSAEENAAAKAEHDKKKPAGDDIGDKVPEDGKYTLAMPEGVELDAELATALGPKFKELGLTNKQAQGLADEFIKVNQGRLKAHAESPEGAWSASAYEYFKVNGTPEKWGDAAKADKDMGGDKWNSTVSAATRAVNTLGSPGLKEFLNASGAGNHPELIRIFAKAGAMIKEDNPAGGGAEGQGKPVEAAHRLFPNDAPKG